MEKTVQGSTCWFCGGPGIPHSGSTWICPKDDVTWFPIWINPKLNDKIVFRGVVLDAVDFTKPDAPSSPA